MPGVTTDEELKLADEDDEKLQTIHSQHSPNENEGPNAYLNQMDRIREHEEGGRYLRVGQKEDDTRFYLHLQDEEAYG